MLGVNDFDKMNAITPSLVHREMMTMMHDVSIIGRLIMLLSCCNISRDPTNNQQQLLLCSDGGSMVAQRTGSTSQSIYQCNDDVGTLLASAHRS